MRCIQNRPTVPGLYWMEMDLFRGLSWSEAESMHESTIEEMAKVGLWPGAFTSSDGTALYGPNFVNGVKSGHWRLDENCTFHYGKTYPFGNPSSPNPVRKIGFYVAITKDSPVPPGAVPPMTACFDDSGKFLYETDSTGKKFTLSAAAKKALASYEQDGLGGYDPTYSEIPDEPMSASWAFDPIEEFGMNDFGFAQTPTANLYDPRYGVVSIPIAQDPYTGELQYAGAGLGTLLVGALTLALLFLYWTGNIRVQYTGINFKDCAPGDTKCKQEAGKSFLQKMIDKAKDAAVTLGLIIVGIALAPSIIGAVLDSISEASRSRRD